jgi:hypothetical protein
MGQHTTLCALALLVLAAGSASAQNLLPEKIASMYTGWVAPNQEDRDLQASLVERMLDPLAGAHFTAFYAKFQGVGDRQFDLTDPEQRARVQLVADACAERDLALVAYTYHHPHHGRNPERFPEHAEMEPLVMASGRVVEDRFALANYDTWRYISDETFQLAEASLEMPIACVGIDIEHFMGAAASYDDEAWADFAAEHDFDAEMPAEQRGPFIAEQGMAEEYTEWYFERWDAVIERWCDEIHQINPEVSIAIMPAHHTHRMTRPFCVHAGTEQAPAVIDDWGMYNGSGLTEELLAEQEEVKNLNPHNRFVLWFRPDSYRPDDIRVQAYHTLMKTGGYCNWHIGMILPGEEATAEECAEADARWEAYAEANETALADIAAGREPTIPFKPVEPMVAEMDLDALCAREIPQLTPVGDGSGEDRWIPTRDLQQFLIHAEGGGQVNVALRHLAGDARPLSLQYALLKPDGSVLRNEAVAPSETAEFSVDVPEAGTYALWITGGAGGQAWYGVQIRNPHFAFPTRGDGGVGGRLFYIKAWGPRTLYLTRSDADAPAGLMADTGRNQIFTVQVNDGDAQLVDAEGRTFELPAGTDPIRLVIGEPEEMPDATYIQGVYLSVEGAVHPYLSIAPERRLLPTE